MNSCLLLQLLLYLLPAHLQTADGSVLPMLCLQQLLRLNPACAVNGPAVDTNTIVPNAPLGVNSEVALKVGVAERLGEPVKTVLISERNLLRPQVS